jgi:Ankyrin repeats (many copies)
MIITPTATNGGGAAHWCGQRTVDNEGSGVCHSRDHRARAKHVPDGRAPLARTRPIGQSLGVPKTAVQRDGSDDATLLALFRAIAARDDREVARRLDASHELAIRPIQIGASRDCAKTYFLTAIHHYVYRGDTALHISAAAYQRQLAESLVTRGADVRAQNRRGAEPLHYAADGGPAASGWDSDAQGAVITYLIETGADPNALDKSGVAPLHRAVRNRCSTAVSVLLDNGADPLLRNKTGSTSLHLAVQNTGKSNSGSQAAKDEQGRIIVLLLGNGASPTDADANGKTVAAAARSDWIRALLGLH